MCKEAFTLLSIVLVLVLTSNVPAATYDWDSGGEGNLWNVSENWDSDSVPTSFDEARVEIPDANCVIDSSVAAECAALYVNDNSRLEMTGGSLTMDGFLAISDATDSNSVMVMSGGVANIGTTNATNGRLRVGYRGIGTLIMTGGEMNVYDKIEIGRQAGAVGNVYVYDGTLNFSGNSTDLELGTNGTGTVYQYGGAINIQDNIKLTQNNPDSVARLYLYGGVMTAGNLRDPEQVLGDPLMDITEGMLILPGDYRDVVNTYITNGWIVPYGGLGILNVEYTTDPNQTTITASNIPPELAQNPNPRPSSTVERTSDGPVLTWEPGAFAVSHDVYFGTDPNAVRDADNSTLGAKFKGNQILTSYDPGPLELGQTYYWRIDEVNEANPDSPWKGNVWEFTVADYIVIDNFESYNDIPLGEEGSHLIYMTWIDGFENPTVNGSTIGYLTGSSLETSRVHSGKQSVPLTYDNTTATYSEVTVSMDDLGVDKDWTQGNFSTLSLWFYGSLINTGSEQMYLKVNDAEALYDGQLNVAAWQEWAIDLASLDTDLSNVTTLTIGFRRTGAVGSRGSILLDDIRLSVSGG
jgi:hypothetical protein